MMPLDRTLALKHPGRHASTQPSSTPGDIDAPATDRAVVEIVADILPGCRHSDDAIQVVPALRSGVQSVVTLETSGGFGVLVDVDCSFERLVQWLEATMSCSTAEPTKTSGPT